MFRHIKLRDYIGAGRCKVHLFDKNTDYGLLSPYIASLVFGDRIVSCVVKRRNVYCIYLE